MVPPLPSPRLDFREGAALRRPPPCSPSLSPQVSLCPSQRRCGLMIHPADGDGVGGHPETAKCPSAVSPHPPTRHPLESEGQFDLAGDRGPRAPVPACLSLPLGMRVAWRNNSFPHPFFLPQVRKGSGRRWGQASPQRPLPTPARERERRGLPPGGCHFGGCGLSRQGQHPLFAAFQGEQQEKERARRAEFLNGQTDATSPAASPRHRRLGAAREAVGRAAGATEPALLLPEAG